MISNWGLIVHVAGRALSHVIAVSVSVVCVCSVYSPIPAVYMISTIRPG